MITRVLIAIGVVWLVIVVAVLLVPFGIVVGLKYVSVSFLVRAIPWVAALFYIGWTFPLAVAAYRIAKSH